MATWIRELRQRFRVRFRAALGRGVELHARVWIHGGGRIQLGDGCLVDGREAAVELHAERGALLALGSGVRLGAGTSIESSTAVTIGDGASLGRFCKVLDNHFHLIRGRRELRPESSPVHVGAGAVLGDRVIVLPGARIAPGAVIPSDAVVRGAARVHGRHRDLAPAQRSRPDLQPDGERSTARRLLEAATSPVQEARAVVARVRAWRLLESAERGPGVRVYGAVEVERGGSLLVGPHTTFAPGYVPSVLRVRPGATLSIGEHCVLNYGTSLDAWSRISIGRRCMFGSMVRIGDRCGERTGPVVIGDDVWLAHGVVVLPGVSVGSGSVLSAGSVVDRDVPSGSFAAGNPARFVPLALAAPGADGATPSPWSAGAAPSRAETA